MHQPPSPSLLRRALSGAKGRSALEVLGTCPGGEATSSCCVLTLQNAPTSALGHLHNRPTGCASAGLPIAEGEKQMEKVQPGKLRCLRAQGTWIFFLLLFFGGGGVFFF